MKTYEEIKDMSEEERELYLAQEVEKIIESASTEEQKNRLRGAQWRIDQLRRLKGKGDNNLEFLLELNRLMFTNLGTIQGKFMELKDLVKPKKLD